MCAFKAFAICDGAIDDVDAFLLGARDTPNNAETQVRKKSDRNVMKGVM